MTREEYQEKLAKLKKSEQYKTWCREQSELIHRLGTDTEAIDPGDSNDEPIFD